MFKTHRVPVLLAALLLPGLLISGAANAQRANNQTTGTAPSEERLVPQAPPGHRQPRAKDLPPPEQTAADREQERKDRELDKRLRICRNC